MIRMIRTAALAGLRAELADAQEAAAAAEDRVERLRADLETARQEAGHERADAALAREYMTRAEQHADRLHDDLAAERRRADALAEQAALLTTEGERLREELDQVREQLAAAEHLDAEDRVALRMLLRAARRQAGRADRVYVLWRYGRLHSLHATQESAEDAAEAEGAPRSAWVTNQPGAALPPASEVAWRVQPLPLGGAR
jgi:chromosome segregation ATPase